MSINRFGGLRRDRWRVKASSREFDHRHNLLMRQMEPIHNLADRSAHFEIVKYDGNRRPGIPKYPCAAALAGDALHGGTLGPIEICHVFASFHRILSERIGGKVEAVLRGQPGSSKL
jgi:hypothetical protein